MCWGTVWVSVLTPAHAFGRPSHSEPNGVALDFKGGADARSPRVRGGHKTQTEVEMGGWESKGPRRESHVDRMEDKTLKGETMTR